MEINYIKSTTTLSNGIAMPVIGIGVYKAKEGREVINSVHHALEAGYPLLIRLLSTEMKKEWGKLLRHREYPGKNYL